MNTALVILTGGQSSRMGSDKARLPFGDKCLLEYLAEKFSAFFPSVYLSVRKTSDYENLNLNIPMIEDIFPGYGPISGIYSVLSKASEDRFIFISVDTPFADPAIAQKMVSLSADHPITLIHRKNNKMTSLFAVYKKSCLAGIEQCFADKNYALKHLHDICPPALVEENELFTDKNLFYSDSDSFHCFFNMNTRQDYYYALRRLGKMEQAKNNIPVLSFVARSGTGKTTYIEKLIPVLKNEGIRLALLKHDAHGFEIDKPGKDSYRFTQAGADHVILTSRQKTAAMIQHEDTVPLGDLLQRISNVDLILTEGYKHENQKKIELLRKGYQETPVSDREHLIALVADFEIDTDLPVFDLNEPAAILPFLLDYLRNW